MNIDIVSFGYKHKRGLPEANFVFDVRRCANPYSNPHLRKKDGRDKEVQDYVLSRPYGKETLFGIHAAVSALMVGCKGVVTIAIGCTGGHHRSVAVAAELAELLRADAHFVTVRHPDIAR